MQLTKIDWPWKPLYVWNPITGCKRGCSYCYAKRNWDRLHRERVGCEFNVITEYPERYEDPIKRKKPCNIFVDSMSDPEWWSVNNKRMLITVSERCPQHTFYVLSKNPKSYVLPVGLEWPENVCCGLTLEHISTPADEHSISVMEYSVNRFFISIEPILGPCYDNSDIVNSAEMVIVGPETRNGKLVFQPPQEWIDHLKSWVPKEKLYFKKGLG